MSHELVAPPSTLPNGETIPIVGQPFQIKAWAPTVLIVCNCEGKHPVMIIGTDRAFVCPGCKKAYQIAALTFEARTKAFNVQLAVGIPKTEGGTSSIGVSI